MNIDELCMGCMELKANNSKCPKCGYEEDKDDFSAHCLPHRTILNGRYLIGKVLGCGGFGITYLALDLNLNIKLAIKEYMPIDCALRGTDGTSVSPYSKQLEDQYEYGLAKFLEEARTLAKFEENPCIVTVRDFFRENDTAYFVMDYVNGMTLKQYLSEHGDKVDYKTAIAVMMPVMDALREIHSHGLLHRDISPENIFITKNRQVKLLDFGAARFALGEKSRKLSVILKPGYAPEEQYRSNGNQGPWTDVYAVASTLYRCLTGQIPPEALERLEEDTIKLPSELGIDIPKTIEDTLMKALSARQKGRIQTIEELQLHLKGYALSNFQISIKDNSVPYDFKKDLTPSVKKSTTNPKVQNQKRPINLKILLPILALLVIFTSGSVFLLISKDSKDPPSTLILQDGSKYNGQITAGKANGYGSLVFKNGDKYEGQFKDNLFEGQGTYTWINGDKYIGEFKNGKFNGKGKYIHADGNIEDGSWVDDVFVSDVK